jgi:hypothetical protein
MFCKYFLHGGPSDARVATVIREVMLHSKKDLGVKCEQVKKRKKLTPNSPPAANSKNAPTTQSVAGAFIM